jgi:hypothetical protein
MTAVKFAEAPEGYRVSFHYSRNVVAAIKATVPPSARRWIPQHKHWTVSEDWADELAAELRSAGHRVIGLDTHRELTDWAESLFEAVGPERCRRCCTPISRTVTPSYSSSSTTHAARSNTATVAK